MSRAKKILITSFILFNFLAMIRVHLSFDNNSVRDLYKPIDPYLSFFSLYQSWNMFSPDPARTQAYISAEVEFDDGSKDTYVFPRASEMGIIQKYVNGERYRVITENIRNDNNSFMWHDTAKFALRKLKEKNFHKVPMRVDLVRHWDEIPDAAQKFIPHLSKATSYKSYKFFTHEVF